MLQSKTYRKTSCQDDDSGFCISSVSAIRHTWQSKSRYERDGVTNDRLINDDVRLAAALTEIQEGSGPNSKAHA